MIKKAKLYAVHFLDYVVDEKILRHRAYWFCRFVSVTLEDWWGVGECQCRRCRQYRWTNEYGSDVYT